MKICGIIAEYNPFHNGHAYQMEQAKALSGADAIVCIMSGNFTQRGEPAIADKWIRAEAALACGADIVLELPLLSAIQSAEGFAAGGVGILSALGADCLSFGCETQDTALLYRAAQLFEEEPEEFRTELKRCLDLGEAFPYARLKAASKILRLGEPEYAVLMNPNAILGLEYIKAILHTGSSMQPVVITREGSGYNEKNLGGVFSSATAIRHEIHKNGFTDELYRHMPQPGADVFCRHFEAGALPVTLENFRDMLFFILRTKGLEYIHSLYEISEGLEHRIFDAAQTYNSVEDLIFSVKTRRYTYTRICRILMYALFGITKEVVQDYQAKGPQYARVLGIRKDSAEALSVLSKRSKIPVITNPGRSERASLHFDVMASDVYAITQKNAPYSETRRDFTQKFFKL